MSVPSNEASWTVIREDGTRASITGPQAEVLARLDGELGALLGTVDELADKLRATQKGLVTCAQAIAAMTEPAGAREEGAADG